MTITPYTAYFEIEEVAKGQYTGVYRWVCKLCVGHRTRTNPRGVGNGVVLNNDDSTGHLVEFRAKMRHHWVKYHFGHGESDF